MYANPIGLIALAVIVVIGVFALLIWKVKAVREAFVSAFNWVRDHWKLLAGILTFPFTGPLVLILTHLHRVKAAVRETINFLIRGWNRLSFHLPGFKVGPLHFGGAKIGTPHIPLLAQGGTILTAGSVIVGERGPELLHLPAAATVRPLARRDAPARDGSSFADRPVVFNFEVNGERLARIVTTYRELIGEAAAHHLLDVQAAT